MHCAFVFDTDILDALENRADRRVAFIRDSVAELKENLERRGGGLHVLHGSAQREIPELAARLHVDAVYAARDYEPFARARDAAVAQALEQGGRRLRLLKDQVIFETDELLTASGGPYHVFTPYKRAWLARLREVDLAAWPGAGGEGRLAPATGAMPCLESLGFLPADLQLPPGESGARQLWRDFQQRLPRYHETRDFPAVKGPSYLSAHLRFGAISPRELARHAWRQGGAGAETWLSELIWREFYQMLLWHYPETVQFAFQKKFAHLPWPDPPGHFDAWAEERTGYPIVDAALRQLHQTGYMHNRLRMIAASFLVKDLHVDWRRGERHFAEHLLDYDQAANVGGWQWSASVGADAQPWFRVFNPVTQSQRFDPDGKFLRRYLPELAGVPDQYLHAPWSNPAGLPAGYPPPIVDHARARGAVLELFKGAG